jgi:hypothetical protein
MLLCTVASGFKEPLKVQQGIEASVLTVRYFICSSHLIDSCPDPQMTGTNPNHVGGTTETHQEFSQAYGHALVFY